MDLDLTAEEIRVLAALVEKEMSTPDYYPMTVNALTNACNQKTNRDPVVAYTEDQVVRALDSLQRRRLVGRQSGAGSRAVKYRHVLAEAWGLAETELAALASLMLRGAETVGEIRGRTARMVDFEDLDDAESTLEGLLGRDPPLVARLEPRPGQKEPRYVHLLGDVPPEEAAPAPAAGDDPGRVAALEAEVAALSERLAALEAAFHVFRAEFE